MPKKLYNLDHDYVVINHGEPAVPPGGAYEFTDEQIEAGVAGLWSEEDPRSGLEAEKAFKKRRDAQASAENIDTPAEPEKE